MTPATAVGRGRNESHARGRRLPRILIGVLAVVGVTGLTGCDDEAADPEEAAAATEQEMPAAEAVDAIPAEEAEVSMMVTGEDGPDGCRYDGPAVMLEGAFAATAVNESDVTMSINLDRFADGYDYDDWLAAHDLASSDGLPAISSQPSASAHDWLAGEWRTVFFDMSSDESQSFEAIPVMPGDYLVSCWTRDGMEAPTARVWAATTVTVLGEGGVDN